MRERINNAVNYMKNNVTVEPEIGLILGSGLGVLADEIEDAAVIKYEDIPDFPVSTVSGHAGQFVIGNLEGHRVIAMQGRFHYYEGYSLKEVTIPVRVMKLLGIEKLLVTNAAGGVNLNYEPGDFMIISDHINLMGDNPLRGQNEDDFGPRFPDMSEAYSENLIKLAEKVAADSGIITRKGVYVAVTGPSYETPAEIRYFRKIGIDAVGMSTVPEVIAANHMGMEVLGISCITNMAAGVLPKPLNHEDVMKIAEKVKPEFIKLLRNILREM